MTQSSRERATLKVGAAIIAAAILWTWAVQPLGRAYLELNRGVRLREHQAREGRAIAGIDARTVSAASAERTERVLALLHVGGDPALLADEFSETVRKLAELSGVTLSNLELPVPAEIPGSPLLALQTHANGTATPAAAALLVRLLQRGGLAQVTQLTMSALENGTVELSLDIVGYGMRVDSMRALFGAGPASAIGRQ